MKKVKISPVDSACIRLLYQKMKLRGKSLLQQFPQYSKATIYRHATKPVGVPHIDKRHLNRGRPPALDARDGRSIMRELPRIRKEHGQYTVKKVMVETGLENKVSRRTVSRFLNKKGLRYLHTRKKGLMNALDLKRKSQICQYLAERQAVQRFSCVKFGTVLKVFPRSGKKDSTDIFAWMTYNQFQDSQADAQTAL